MQLREDFAKQRDAAVLELAEHAAQRLFNILKSNCDDFEGDHWVPRRPLTTSLKQLDLSWTALMGSAKSSLAAFAQLPGEPVSFALSDPLCEDCPLVYVSKQFEELSGYHREWIIGRNCRFLQPNLQERNRFFNKAELSRLKAFSSGPKEPGTRLVSLLLNESKDKYPFWNLLLMEHVVLEGRPLILGLQTSLKEESARLAEMLTMSAASLQELARLREIVYKLEWTFGQENLEKLAKKCTFEWAAGFPKTMELPSLVLPHFRGAKQVKVTGQFSLPVAGLVLPHRTRFLEPVIEGLKEGLRHFILLITSKGLESVELAKLEGRLLALRLAETLNGLQQAHFHYLRGAISFSLVSCAECMVAIPEILKALSSHGYALATWMLDVRGLTVAKLAECWQQMAAKQLAGQVKAIGLFGGSVSASETWQRAQAVVTGEAAAVPLALWAFESFPGKVLDRTIELKQLSFLAKLRRSGACLLAHAPFGPKAVLLESPALQAEARRLGLDVAQLLVKWAQAQGIVAMIPKLRAERAEPLANDGGARAHSLEGCAQDSARRWVATYATGPGPQACARSIQRALALPREAVLHEEAAGMMRSRANSIDLPGGLPPGFVQSESSAAVPRSRRHSFDVGLLLPNLEQTPKPSQLQARLPAPAQGKIFSEAVYSSPLLKYKTSTMTPRLPPAEARASAQSSTLGQSSRGAGAFSGGPNGHQNPRSYPSTSKQEAQVSLPVPRRHPAALSAGDVQAGIACKLFARGWSVKEIADLLEIATDTAAAFLFPEHQAFGMQHVGRPPAAAFPGSGGGG